MSPVIVYACAASLIAGAGGAWVVQGWRFDAARTAAAERAGRDLAKAVEVQDRAVAEYLKGKQNADVVFRTITEEVEVIVERPVYRNVCLDDDGLRALGRAIDNTAPGPQPGADVPAAAEAK